MSFSDSAFWREIKTLHLDGLTGEGARIGHLDSGVVATTKLAGFAAVSPSGLALELGNPHDETGHGSQTASVLTDSALGIVPQAQVWSVGVIETGNIVARIAAGLDWLLTQDISVIVMPIGLASASPAISALIDRCVRQDVLVVCPVGNGGAGRALYPGTSVQVLSVGACNTQNHALPFSGSTVDALKNDSCIAPHVLTLGENIPVRDREGRMANFTGTSIAAALIGGLAALMRAAVPSASAEAIKDAIITSSTSLAPIFYHRACFGAVSPIRALACLKNTERMPPQPVSAPSYWTSEIRLQKRLRQSSNSAQIDIVAQFTDFGAKQIDMKGAKTYWLSTVPICLIRTTVSAGADILKHQLVVSVELADIDRRLSL